MLAYKLGDSVGRDVLLKIELLLTFLSCFDFKGIAPGYAFDPEMISPHSLERRLIGA